ncbi:ubiquitin-like protein-like protein SMT3 [Lophiotrema nucula]|uniref:Ubiquitin-like protein-like protein SMT3 n=1 Tax=Lophiotrema nucula TaxID=690887 RepID=A0A6A5YHU6_9PLEO|nr:ubiquitin-like protein-like protein SMT3 [Lophiotrema nucula]
MSNDASPNHMPPPADAPLLGHINIKLTDNNNELFFKVKPTTPFGKVMETFCKRQGKDLKSVRFLFEGQRIRKEDTCETLDVQDGDAIEVHQEQLGGT